MSEIAVQLGKLPFNVFRFDFPAVYGILPSKKSAPMQRFSQFDRFAALPAPKKVGSGLARSVHPR